MMLKIENEFPARPGSRLSTRRGIIVGGLLALTIGGVNLNRPARAQDRPGRLDRETVVNLEEVKKAPPVAINRPFEVRYLSENRTGMIAFRPAAIARRWGSDRLATWLRMLMQDQFTTLVQLLKLDQQRLGAVKLGAEEIDSVVCAVGFDVAFNPANDPNNPWLLTIKSSALAIQTVAPFDWLAYFRLWNLRPEEIKVPNGLYYKVKIPGLNVPASIYFPDERTLIFDTEAWISKWIAHPPQEGPAFLRGADWDQVSRGLIAFALDNHDGAFAKSYDPSRPDDAVILSVLNGVDRWVLGISDSESPAFQALATCSNPEASVQLSRALQPIINLGWDQVSAPATLAMNFETPGIDRMLEVGKRFFNKLQVRPVDRSVRVSSEAFVRFDEVVSLLETTTKDVKR